MIGIRTNGGGTGHTIGIIGITRIEIRIAREN
jgi:hypothetical protein